jgi:alanine racemase
MASTNLFNSRSWVEIDLARIRENYRLLRKKIKSSSQILAIVKADAYGHGLVPVARELLQLGTPAFGVGSAEEGILIRKKVSPDVPVVLLLGIFPEETATCLQYRLTPVIYSIETALKLHQTASRRKIRVPVHIKVDTGMGRLGVPWLEFGEFFNKIKRLNSLEITGLTSHFGQADDTSTSYNSLQWKRFGKVLDLVHESGVKLTENHMANSAALLNYRESHLHFVRSGILLYGCDPKGNFGQKRTIKVQPVLSLKSRILQVKSLPSGVEISYGGTYVTPRPETIAVLPVGYANGYPRSLSNCGKVLIRGKRFPIIGRVCMNLTMVRVDSSLGIRPGEEAVLLGAQGNQAITPDELAVKAGTISYELFCSLGSLNPRKYLGN